MSQLTLHLKQNIRQLIRNVLSEGELRQDSVVKDLFTTAADGKAMLKEKAK